MTSESFYFHSIDALWIYEINLKGFITNLFEMIDK
jgi:hypothetical protein